MAHLPWNDDYTKRTQTADGDPGWKLRDILEPFNEAIQERENLQSIAGGDFTVTALAAADNATEWIRSLYGRIESLAGTFCRRFAGDGSEYWPAGDVFVDTCLQEYVATGFSDTGAVVNDLTFPYPNGWTRKLPREIYKLSYGGSDGQVARFVILGDDATATDGTWTRCLRGDGLFNSTDRTPLSEYGNAGKLFRRDSGAWVPETSSGAVPDVLSEFITGVDSHTWAPLPGDYLDWTTFNELRDALNQLAKPIIAGSDDVGSAGDNGPFSYALPWYYTESGEVTNYNGVPGGGPGGSAGPGGPVEYTQAYSEGLYDALGVTGGGFRALFPGSHSDGWFEAGGSGSYAHANSSEGAVAVRNADLPNLPNTLTVKIKTYWSTAKDGEVFDAYGSGAVDDDRLLHQVGGEVTGTFLTESNLLGHRLATHPVPWYAATWPDAPGDPGVTASGGYVGTRIFMIFDLRVVGGFKWTELSED